MASAITVFLLVRSSTAMNSSELSTLPCLSPILTSNSSVAPSHTTTLAVVFSYMPSTTFTSASGTPIHRSVTIDHHLSVFCVKRFLQVVEPQSHTALYLQYLLYHLSQDVHPVCCSSPLPEPLLFFPEVIFYSFPDPCV